MSNILGISSLDSIENEARINTLPEELLINIFNFVEWNILKMKPHHVCRRWAFLFKNYKIEMLIIPRLVFFTKNTKRNMHNFFERYKGFKEITFIPLMHVQKLRFFIDLIDYITNQWRTMIIFLDLAGCRTINWKLIDTILRQRCTSLKELNVNYCTNLIKGVDGGCNSFLKGLEGSLKLERLHMNGYRQKHPFCKLLLRACKSLTFLKINDIACDVSEELFNFNDLRYLSMRRCFTPTIDHVLVHCKKITYLDIYGCQKEAKSISKHDAIKYFQVGQNLKTLIIFFNQILNSRHEMVLQRNEDEYLSSSSSSDNIIYETD